MNFIIVSKKIHKRLFELVVQVLAFFYEVASSQIHPLRLRFSKSATKVLLFFDICKFCALFLLFYNLFCLPEEFEHGGQMSAVIAEIIPHIRHV